MNAGSVIAFAVCVAAGSFVQGLLGFGSALIAAPLALLVVDKAIAVPALGIAGCALNVLLLITIRARPRRDILVPLIWSALAGMPLGLIVLKRLPVAALQITVGVLSVVFAALIAGSKPRAQLSMRAAPVAGLVSGALSTSTSMGGPPVVLLLAHGDVVRDQNRRTLAIFFLTAGLLSLVFFAVGGVLTATAATAGAVSLPGAVLGGLAGNAVSAHVPHRHFRLIGLVAVGITGLTAVVAGLLSL